MNLENPHLSNVPTLPKRSSPTDTAGRVISLASHRRGQCIRNQNELLPAFDQYDLRSAALAIEKQAHSSWLDFQLEHAQTGFQIMLLDIDSKGAHCCEKALGRASFNCQAVASLRNRSPLRPISASRSVTHEDRRTHLRPPYGPSSLSSYLFKALNCSKEELAPDPRAQKRLQRILSATLFSTQDALCVVLNPRHPLSPSVASAGTQYSVLHRIQTQSSMTAIGPA